MGAIRNVLFISVDCLRADRFRDGIESGILPNVASLEERGTTFDAAYTVANTTDPSLTSFLTGAYPFDHGVIENGWGLDPEFPVAASRFRDAGYDTFGVVSVDHLNHEHSGLGRGFDRYFDGESYDTLYPILSRIYDTKTFNAIFGAIKDVGTDRYSVKRLLRETGLIELHCRSAESVTADAIEGLDGVEEPFFGWVHYFDVHEPRNAPPAFLDDHDEYTAAMMHVDRHVGTLLEELEARDLTDETLVVLTGDHGEALDEHGYTGHGRTLYDEELHIPLVFAHESLPADTVETQVRTIDVLPTVLDLVDANPLESAGEPVFDDDPVTADRPLFAMAYPTFCDRVALRRDGWKLIRDRENGDTERLYDLEDDPDERTDLADDDHVRQRLATELDDWLHSFGDTERQEVDAETEEMLADLGYTE
ncbi:sulfatase [Halomontanus rarus]|uniref:sulfatase n=1 Tax=Halomontanus rarus TaxID=3034020 RepID=UPI00307C66D8